MSNTPSRNRRIVVIAVVAAVVLVAGIAAVIALVASARPQNVTAAQLVGAWTSADLPGTITFAADGSVAFDSIGLNLVTNSHAGADFDGTGEYLLDHPMTTGETLELQWATATDDGADQLTAPRTFTSVRLLHSGGELQLQFTDFTTETDYRFERTGD